MKLLRLLAVALCVASPALAQVNPGTSPLSIAKGGTSAATAAAARTALGLLIGTNVQAWDADLDAVSALACTGSIVRTASNTVTCRTITGTAAEITVTNGDGVAGVPTLSLPAALTFTGKTVTGGTFASVTMTAPALGTPASGVATNLTGTAAGLTAGNATLAATVTTNANLTGNVTSVGNATTLAAGSAAVLNSGTLLAARMPALTGDITSSVGTVATTLAAGNAGNLNSGTLLAARMPALTGDCTTSAGAVATTCTKINGVDQTTAWSQTTPTPVSIGGAFGSATAVVRQKTIGKTVFVWASVTVTSVGTATSGFTVAVPTAATNTSPISGIDNNIGTGFLAYVSSSTLTFSTSISAHVYYANGTYESP